jgi:hypothetical protein
MEFTPCHPQPFTFQQAISFDPEVSADGMLSRFQNRISKLIQAQRSVVFKIPSPMIHLKRTQEELQKYAEDPDIAQAIKENNETMSVQGSPWTLLHLLRSEHAHTQSIAR